MTKVAIAAESDTDKYEYKTVVRCQVCATEFPSDALELSAVVDGVMCALSSAQQSEVKAWEQEMTACEHTLTLQQEPTRMLEDRALATCSKCDLNENLWLCLVCGTLSCGRTQFGGGGGNGHGLQHVESTSHSLAVKLGSITPEGTADVYCYSCDEERVDPLLQEHLAHWGIKLANRTKTERSLQEMQIEQNMKWEFSMTDEDGKEMTPLSGPGLTGMKNIGNSCYLASIMQALFALPQFGDRFFVPFQRSSSKVVASPQDDLEVQMRKMADGLLSGEFAIPYKSGSEERDFQLGIAPSMLKALLGKGHAEFGTMRQQDAFEFLLFLVEKLNKLQPPSGHSNPTDSFQFLVEQRTQCLGCQKVSYKTTEQSNISVLVPARKVSASSDVEDGVKYEDVTVIELLDIFTASEAVQYKCSECSSSAGATKQTLFKTFPATLVLNPGRFALENWVPMKLEIPVIVPDGGFNLDHYLSKGQQPDEELLPEDSSPSTSDAPRANEADIEQLMAMGFPRVRAEKALLTTKAGPEAAMEWLFAHMEDDDIDEPFVDKLSTAKAGSPSAADATIVSSLMDMGFPQVRCRKAALATGNNGVEIAMDWLMQHMDDRDIDEEEEVVVEVPPPPAKEDVQMGGMSPDADASTCSARQFGTAELPARYTAKAMACHKGSSIHAGHYVAFVKKEIEDVKSDTTAAAAGGGGGGGGGTGGQDWVLFNDEKVLRGVDWQEASKTAYVYFFTRL